jgi:hypothetical protein
MRTRLLLAPALFAICVLALILPVSTQACLLCGPPTSTLSEQFANADVVVVATWVKAHADTDQTGGSTTLRIARVIKGGKEVRLKQDIVLDLHFKGTAGDSFLLTGHVDNEIEWRDPLAVDSKSLAYILETPDPKKTPRERLPYFLNYLEHTSSIVANDAHGELANAEFADLVALAPKLPREKLRKWLVSETTQQTRIGLYGVLLGLCGDQSDSNLLAQKIQHREGDPNFRLGVDGLIGGYLLLSGADGLNLIDETKLRNSKAPFSETFSAVQAIQFMWTYSNGKIPKQRLRESMRIMLDRPEIADIAIADLARWQDWEIQDSLIERYGKGGYDTTAVKRASIRFLLAAIDSAPADREKPQPKYLLDAEKNLRHLKMRDPKLVADVLRFTRSDEQPVTPTSGRAPLLLP